MKDFKLNNENKITSGFVIPDGYFEAFSDTILEQLPKEKLKVITVYNSRKNWYYAVAAVVILMLSISIYNKYKFKQEELDSVTLENYIACHSNISEDEIVKLLEQQELDKMKIELNAPDHDIEDILQSNSNLEEYLIN